jgi:hypothetical protein
LETWSDRLFPEEIANVTFAQEKSLSDQKERNASIIFKKPSVSSGQIDASYPRIDPERRGGNPERSPSR